MKCEKETHSFTRNTACESEETRFHRPELTETAPHVILHPPATPSCAVAYNCARIRRLVRLGGGLYRLRVADESAIGFSDPDHSRHISVPCFVADLTAISLWRLYVGDLRVYRVPMTGSLTRVQPPPISV